jgi:hypothetical protein
MNKTQLDYLITQYLSVLPSLGSMPIERLIHSSITLSAARLRNQLVSHLGEEGIFRLMLWCITRRRHK